MSFVVITVDDQFIFGSRRRSGAPLLITQVLCRRGACAHGSYLKCLKCIGNNERHPFRVNHSIWQLYQGFGKIIQLKLLNFVHKGVFKSQSAAVNSAALTWPKLILNTAGSIDWSRCITVYFAHNP
jgi:hypothetical protein